MRLTQQLSLFDANADCDNFDASSSSSSKDTSPMVDVPAFPSSSFSTTSNGIDDKEPFKHVYETELRFYNDYFKSEERNRLNHSFRSIKSPSKPKLNEAQSQSFDLNRPRHGSLRHDFKSTASLEQVSYRCLMESLSGIDKKKVFFAIWF